MLVDRIQRDFTCCGIVGPEDWISSNYNNINSSAFERGITENLPEQGSYRIPRSCCKVGFDTCLAHVDKITKAGRINEIDGVNTKGCMKKFENFIRDKWYLVVLAGCVLLAVQLLALLFACFFCCAITRQEDK